MNIGELITEYGDQIIGSFAILAIVGLIYVFVTQWENFTGKGGNWLRGLIVVMGYLFLIAVVLGVAAYIRANAQL